MTKFFTKSKKPYFGAILNLFCPNLDKNEFSWEKGLCQSLNIPIIQKTKKRAIPYRKCWTDGWTDRQTDRQWWKNPLNDGGPKRPILHKTDNTVLYNSWLKMSLNKNFNRCVSILILRVLSTEIKIKSW